MNGFSKYLCCYLQFRQNSAPARKPRKRGMTNKTEHSSMLSYRGRTSFKLAWRLQTFLGQRKGGWVSHAIKNPSLLFLWRIAIAALTLLVLPQNSLCDWIAASVCTGLPSQCSHNRETGCLWQGLDQHLLNRQETRWSMDTEYALAGAIQQQSWWGYHRACK